MVPLVPSRVLFWREKKNQATPITPLTEGLFQRALVYFLYESLP